MGYLGYKYIIGDKRASLQDNLWLSESKPHGNVFQIRVHTSNTAPSTFLPTKTMISIMVILPIAMISFLVKPENFGPRISLNVTTFLAAVANHLNLTAS